MKKNVLSLAVAAGLVGVASAASANMYINDRGLGEALIYPFYTAENDFDTYIHVTNTTNHYKAVKVRILESMNSWEVLDFNLYLSPYDMFTFGITESSTTDGAVLKTFDVSCTAPAIESGAEIPLTNLKYDEETGGEDLGRTKTGYVEIIEMGQITDAGLQKAIKHVNGVAPCTPIIDAWSTGGPWFTGDLDYGFDSSWNGGGLFGTSTLVNPENAFSVGVDAVAIDDLVDVASNLRGIVNRGAQLHYAPGDEEPNFQSADIDTKSTVFINGVATDLEFTAKPRPDDQVDAVSSLFMVTELMNEYIIDDGRKAATDWVATQPTKFFYVDGSVAEAPYTSVWDEKKLEACEPFSLRYWDREEREVRITNGPVFSPSEDDPEDFEFCVEAAVFQMGDRPAIGDNAGNAGMYNVVDLSGSIVYNEGWARMNFDPTTLNTPALQSLNRDLTPDLVDGQAVSGAYMRGLPVTGFAVNKLFNSESGAGDAAYYASAWLHKTTVLTSGI